MFFDFWQPFTSWLLRLKVVDPPIWIGFPLNGILGETPRCAKTLWDFPPRQLQPVMVVPGQPQQLHLPLRTGATPGVLKLVANLSPGNRTSTLVGEIWITVSCPLVSIHESSWHYQPKHCTADRHNTTWSPWNYDHCLIISKQFPSSSVWSSSFFPKCIFLGEWTLATFTATFTKVGLN